MNLESIFSETAKANSALKLGISALALALIAAGGATIVLANREPLLIERGCNTVLANKSADTSRSEEELKAFVRENLPLLWTSSMTEELNRTGVLPEALKSQAAQEMKELNAKGLESYVVVHEVNVEGSRFRASADRIFSAQDVRTAMSLDLSGEVSSVPRSPLNPYGLILSGIQKPTSVAETAAETDQRDEKGGAK
jgi:hypothetical protein